ncbi:MAG: VanW family protein [Defluviitaleaceae bacterium]|nr:VanW family protein [Defluviitaleaceae bacterium]
MFKYIAILSLCLTLAGCYTSVPRNYSQNQNVTRSNYAENPLLTEVNASEAGGKLSEFSTDFKNPKKARAHNITLAAQKIDESVIQPGEEFSFNGAVGPTTKRNGFMLGMIFNSGRRSQGYGGGVCQVSSTLFNAAKQAGMEITERHEHSLDVGYIERGRDAATSYGVKDLKFVNPHEYPVRINAYVMNEKIITEIHRA